MCRTLQSLIIVSVMLGGIAPVYARDDPPSIVKKAMAAQGGESLLRQARAARIRAKGNIPHPAHPDSGIPFRAAFDFQLPDRFRLSIDAKMEDESKFSSNQVFNRGKVWSTSSFDEKVDNAAGELELSRWAYVENLRSLFPLLDDKESSLKFVGESKAKDRTLLEITVTAKGKPDVRLFFDKTAGFLVSAEYRTVDSDTKKEVSIHYDFDDYREIQSTSAEEELLKSAKVGTDGPALAEYIRKRTIGEEEREQIKSLVRKFGDSSFDVREKAKDDLIAKGSAAARPLTEALKAGDPEVVSRAKDCLEKIGAAKDSALTVAALRLLAQTKEPGAVTTLLAFAPSASDDSVAQEVATSLAVLGVRDGKPDPQLEKALEDKDPQARAIAAAALKRDLKDTKKLPGIRLLLPGLKWPMKEVLIIDGKKYYDWEATEVLFYSNLSDALFAKP
jgi:hypothetical protein